MATVLYNSAKQGFLDGSIDWDTATIKVALVRGYTFSAAHSTMTDVGATTVGTAQTLTTKTVTNGVADADDPTFPSVPAGAAIPALVIYQASAPTGGADVAAGSQRLILYTDAYTNLPITPNGGNITIAFDNGASKIFAL